MNRKLFCGCAVLVFKGGHQCCVAMESVQCNPSWLLRSAIVCVRGTRSSE